MLSPPVCKLKLKSQAFRNRSQKRNPLQSSSLKLIVCAIFPDSGVKIWPNFGKSARNGSFENFDWHTQQQTMEASTPDRRPTKAHGSQLTTAERFSLCAEWAITSAPGAKLRLCRAWKVSRQTAWRVVTKFLSQVASPGAIVLSRATKSGRPSALKRDGRWEEVLGSCEVHKRRTYRKWSCRADVPKSTLHRWAKVMELQRRARFIKPKLTIKHKRDRMAFVISRVDSSTKTSRHPLFSNHYDVVHVDEKWFYLLSDGSHVLVAPGEEVPAPPRVQHKSHIPKAMFVALSARPQPERGFDGKVGIFSCTELVEAKRRSKNHDAGDLKEVDVPVTAEYYREVMEKKILPAIMEHMPWVGKGGRTLVIQHDGAKAHTGKGNDEYWGELATSKYPGRRIEVVTQPAQSPDLNTLDLGFFNSLARMADDMDPESLSELLDAVDVCYWDYDPKILERVWQAQFNVYNSILAARGDNNFKLPHTGVSKRQRAGELALRVPVNTHSFAACRALLAK
jgi:hypothetical protein